MVEQLSFEQALARLEETVQALEAGNLTLEASLTLYEEGLRLARVCHQHLDAAQLKISQVEPAQGESPPR